MADRKTFKFVGFVFACLTMAAAMMAVMTVKGFADGRYQFDAPVKVEVTR